MIKSSISNHSWATEKNQILSSSQTNSPNTIPNNIESLQTLSQSIQYLEQVDSILAGIELHVSLFDHEFVGDGEYKELLDHQPVPFLPQSSNENRDENDSLTSSSQLYRTSTPFPLQNSLFRLHIKMYRQKSKASQENSSDNILEIVCDKDHRTLWTYSSIEGTKNLTQINLEDLADALSRLNESERKELQNKQVQLPCLMSGLPGLGGISGMLKQLIYYYNFNASPVKTSIANGKIPVWKISGELKSNFLNLYRKTILEGLSENDPISLGLTDNIPTHIEIYIGCETPFPYRLAYFSQMDEKRMVQKQLFLLEYTKIKINSSFVREDDFIYRPPYITHERINEQYLQQLIPQIEF
ncbi:MAG: hypothetical protein Q4C95_05235 [Planctomycetia bacterium]|nr:hypothetical protein [Planctomycetia bacterium]